MPCNPLERCSACTKCRRLDAFRMLVFMMNEFSHYSIVDYLKHREDGELQEMVELLKQLPQGMAVLKFTQEVTESMYLRSFKHMPNDKLDDSPKDFSGQTHKGKLHAMYREREKHMNVACKRREKREQILHETQAKCSSTCKAGANKVVHRKEKKVYLSMDDMRY